MIFFENIEQPEKLDFLCKGDMLILQFILSSGPYKSEPIEAGNTFLSAEGGLRKLQLFYERTSNCLFKCLKNVEKRA